MSFIQEKRQPVPIRLWAVVVQNPRCRWIHWPSVRRTRADAIARFVDEHEPGPIRRAWARARRAGHTCEVVEVSVVQWARAI